MIKDFLNLLVREFKSCNAPLLLRIEVLELALGGSSKPIQ